MELLLIVKCYWFALVNWFIQIDSFKWTGSKKNKLKSDQNVWYYLMKYKRFSSTQTTQMSRDQNYILI